LSFKGALDLLNAFAETLRQGPRGQLASCQAHLLASMARLKLPDRPGRVEPRAIKRRPKPHRLLTKPRHTWRARLVFRSSAVPVFVSLCVCKSGFNLLKESLGRRAMRKSLYSLCETTLRLSHISSFYSDPELKCTELKCKGIRANTI
jgi:hypothetical protein